MLSGRDVGVAKYRQLFADGSSKVSTTWANLMGETRAKRFSDEQVVTEVASISGSNLVKQPWRRRT